MDGTVPFSCHFPRHKGSVSVTKDTFALWFSVLGLTAGKWVWLLLGAHWPDLFLPDSISAVQTPLSGVLLFAVVFLNPHT